MGTLVARVSRNIGVSITSSVCISCELIEDYQTGEAFPKVTGLEGRIGGALGFPLTLASLGMAKKQGKGLGSWGTQEIPKG